MKRSHLRWVGIVLVALFVIVELVWGVRTYRAARGLWSAATEAQALMAVGPMNAPPEEIGELLASVRADFVALRRNVGWLAPLGRAFSWLPEVGGIVGQATPLFELADTFTEAGVLLWEGLGPSFARYQEGASPQSLLPDVFEFLNAKRTQLDRLLHDAESAYAALEVTALPIRLQDPMTKLGVALPLLEDALAAAEVAPSLLGMDQPRTYLALALNEDELRPGGGFISGVGEVTVHAGEIISMTFRDSYAVDDFGQPYPDPPEPLRRFMGLDLWVFRDSNWSPDFPTSARQAIELYRPGYEVEVDGVIAVDQAAVQGLVAAMAPLSVVGVEEPITGSNLLDYMHSAWAPDDGQLDGGWWRQRKSFMNDLAGAMMSRLESGNMDVQAVARAMMELLNQRHLQIYVVDPVARALFAKHGWDGALAVPEGDFLMPVEANIGYNKASSNVARAIRYEVDLSGSPPRGNVSLRYQHLSQREVSCVAESRYDVAYTDMMHRCYWAHVRLFVPEGTALLEASSHPIPADKLITGRRWPGEVEVALADATTIFSQAFLMEPKAAEELTFSYLLPGDIVVAEPDGRRTYRLRVAKQAGLDAPEIGVALRLPENAVVLAVHPDTHSTEAGVLLFEAALRSDLEIEVEYRLAEGSVQ
ncbi:MAG: DUF4012 domain-containing protein [Anaerolineae bacterium]